MLNCRAVSVAGPGNKHRLVRSHHHTDKRSESNRPMLRRTKRGVSPIGLSKYLASFASTFRKEEPVRGRTQ